MTATFSPEYEQQVNKALAGAKEFGNKYLILRDGSIVERELWLAFEKQENLRSHLIPIGLIKYQINQFKQTLKQASIIIGVCALFFLYVSMASSVQETTVYCGIASVMLLSISGLLIVWKHYLSTTIDDSIETVIEQLKETF